MNRNKFFVSLAWNDAAANRCHAAKKMNSTFCYICCRCGPNLHNGNHKTFLIPRKAMFCGYMDQWRSQEKGKVVKISPSSPVLGDRFRSELLSDPTFHHQTSMQINNLRAMESAYMPGLQGSISSHRGPIPGSRGPILVWRGTS